MADVLIRPLQTHHLSQLSTVITGYSTTEIYAVQKVEHELETAVSLKLQPLSAPQTITYTHLDDDELTRLSLILDEGLSVGAFFEDELVGVAIGSLEVWNKSLRVWEFHVAESFRRQEIGRKLMDKMVETAVAQKLRVIVCETQSNNVPAIRAYRKLGFTLDAIDLSFYSNDDERRQSVAVFMKLKV